MEIKGVYNEKTYKKEKEKEKEYGPKMNYAMEHTTAGQFLQEAKKEEAPYYAFRPQKTIEQVKNNFLNDLKTAANVEFYNSAVKTIRVIRQYFPVNYIDVHSVPDSRWVETRHYNPSGEYSIDGKLEGDTLKVDVSQGSTYSHSTYDRETFTRDVNKKKYYEDIHTYFWQFSEKFFETNEVDESALMPAEELMQDPMFSYQSPRYILGRDASYKLLQVLLFPIWRVECDFDGHTYVNYVSDVAPSKILYLELSQEEEARREEKKRVENLIKLEEGLQTTLYGLVGVSVIVHLLGLAMALQGLGYCGFFIVHLGKVFGSIITVLCCPVLFSVITNIVSNKLNKFESKRVLYYIMYAMICIEALIYIISVFQYV